MRTINTTYGYRTEKNGKTYYSASSTANGMCYKDEDAWRSGKGICYISEYEFLDNDEMNFEDKEYDTDLGYTREMIIDEIFDHLEYYHNCNDRQIAEHIAEYVFQELDWQSVGTLIEDMDFSEDIEDYYRK